MKLVHSFGFAFTTLFVVGCAVSTADGDSQETEDPITSTSTSTGGGKCGSNSASASGTGTKTDDWVLGACPIADSACRNQLWNQFGGFQCPTPYNLMNDAQKEAIAQCDQRLATALAGIGCPSSCPNASSGGTCIANQPAGFGFVQAGILTPAYWAIWCHEVGSASAQGSGNVQCSSSCGDGGDGGGGGDGGCKEAGSE